jgi:hypothetical protein
VRAARNMWSMHPNLHTMSNLPELAKLIVFELYYVLGNGGKRDPRSWHRRSCRLSRAVLVVVCR